MDAQPDLVRMLFQALPQTTRLPDESLALLQAAEEAARAMLRQPELELVGTAAGAAGLLLQFREGWPVPLVADTVIPEASYERPNVSVPITQPRHSSHENTADAHAVGFGATKSR